MGHVGRSSHAGSLEAAGLCRQDSAAMGRAHRSVREGTTGPLAAGRGGYAPRFRPHGPPEGKERLTAAATISAPTVAENGSKEELEMAWRLAREHLLLASSRAVFELLSNLGAGGSPTDVRVRLRAAALVREGVRLPRQRRSTFLTEVLAPLDDGGWGQPA